MKKKNIIITIILTVVAIVVSFLSFCVVNDANLRSWDSFYNSLHDTQCLYGCPYYKKKDKKYFFNLLKILKRKVTI